MHPAQETFFFTYKKIISEERREFGLSLAFLQGRKQSMKIKTQASKKKKNKKGIFLREPRLKKIMFDLLFFKQHQMTGISSRLLLKMITSFWRC